MNSLLLSTVIESAMEYRELILQNPVTIYFTPTPLVGTPRSELVIFYNCTHFFQKSNFSNESCVFWDTESRY